MTAAFGPTVAVAGPDVRAPLAASVLPATGGSGPATGRPGRPGPWTTVAPSTAGPADPNAVVPPRVGDDERPAGHRLTPARARAIARGDPEVAREARATPGSYDSVFLKGRDRWQLSVYAPGRPLREIGQVIVDDRTGRVTESWTGPYVAWTMARGQDGAFGGVVTNPLVWLPLLGLFLLPFVRLRPRIALPPAPLLLLAGFSVPLAFFGAARLPPAVLTSALLLVGLLAVGLAGALRRPRLPRPLDIGVPFGALAVLAAALLGFRAVLAVTGGNVIDVGYASVVGADRLAGLDQLYGRFPEGIERGDTYGPLTYLLYVPFELLWPWGGDWGSLGAATAAAVAIDAAVVVALYRLGTRTPGPGVPRSSPPPLAGGDPAAPVAPAVRAAPGPGPPEAEAEAVAARALARGERRRAGRRRGVLYAYLWLACPWSLYALCSAANDALVALLLVVVLAAVGPGGRAVGIALAAAAKLAPAALLPVVATHPVREPPPGEAPRRRGPRLRPRHLVGFAVVAGSVVVAAVAIGLVGGGTPALLVERTLGYQADRDAPFTPWGLYDWDAVTAVLRVLAVLLALALALLPRREDRAGLAAAMLAVLVAFQLATEYWFYLYLTWLLPLVLVVVVHGRALRFAPAPPGWAALAAGRVAPVAGRVDRLGSALSARRTGRARGSARSTTRPAGDPRPPAPGPP